MLSGFSFDESRRPLVVVRLWGALSDDQFRAYLAGYDALMDRGRRVVVVIDARGVAPAPASQRKMQGDWLTLRGVRVRELLVGMAFVISSPMVRALITAVFWWKPLPCAYAVLKTMHDALDWAGEACSKEGLTVPPFQHASPSVPPPSGTPSRESTGRQSTGRVGAGRENANSRATDPRTPRR